MRAILTAPLTLIQEIMNKPKASKKDKADFRLLMLDLCKQIESKEAQKKNNKEVFFSEEIDDVLGLNVFKK